MNSDANEHITNFSFKDVADKGAVKVNVANSPAFEDLVHIAR